MAKEEGGLSGNDQQWHKFGDWPQTEDDEWERHSWRLTQEVWSAPVHTLETATKLLEDAIAENATTPVKVTVLLEGEEEAQEWKDLARSSKLLHYTAVRVLGQNEALKDGEIERTVPGRLGKRFTPRRVAVWKSSEEALGQAVEAKRFEEEREHSCAHKNGKEVLRGCMGICSKESWKRSEGVGFLSVD